MPMGFEQCTVVNKYVFKTCPCSNLETGLLLLQKSTLTNFKILKKFTVRAINQFLGRENIKYRSNEPLKLLSAH